MCGPAVEAIEATDHPISHGRLAGIRDLIDVRTRFNVALTHLPDFGNGR